MPSGWSGRHLSQSTMPRRQLRRQSRLFSMLSSPASRLKKPRQLNSAAFVLALCRPCDRAHIGQIVSLFIVTQSPLVARRSLCWAASFALGVLDRRFSSRVNFRCGVILRSQFSIPDCPLLEQVQTFPGSGDGPRSVRPQAVAAGLPGSLLVSLFFAPHASTVLPEARSKHKRENDNAVKSLT